ncbi:hypothetical protein HX881_15780 [Pseudomonas gingeri]|uniref:Uncharacterized protein n=1 Tax=Pseudomonas gingeri TaxID=117681 RepID=A0A7Y8CF38_9PSED|nr:MULTISPECIES: hypothetical protein [Pseudomonas]NVZ27014.1 hypothetical protein [Pseudomonas gingeri]NVZ66094.1 hypothetical protein [Pseudomonas gingeri]NVZ78661.1 hypothetical protein [Pseudomonas gingeri]NWA10035.1 hypothetical protein [Pseudomonas gingeri]NWC15837.1 hypothetical protein [Pseudomonas gingeri]
MNILKTRKCAAVLAVCAVVALYATAAWRVEQLRQTPRNLSTCNLEHCVPHTASLSALR